MLAVPRKYKQEVLFDRSCEKRAFLNGTEKFIPPGVSILERVAVVWELVKSCCS
jgi:hypothetical protein